MKTTVTNSAPTLRYALDTLAVAYGLLFVMSVVVLFGIAKAMDESLSQFPVNYLIFFAMLAILWMQSGLLLLIFVQCYLIFREPMGLRDYDFVANTVMPILVIVAIAASYRLNTLRIHRKSSAIEWLWSSIFLVKDAYRSATEDRFRLFHPFLKQQVGLMTSVLACLLLAGLSLAIVGRREDADSMVGLLPKELQAIAMGALLTVVFLATLVFTGYWKWRSFSGSQARIYLRSQYAAWLEDDQHLIIRRRRKLRRLETLPKKRRRGWFGR